MRLFLILALSSFTFLTSSNGWGKTISRYTTQIASKPSAADAKAPPATPPAQVEPAQADDLGTITPPEQVGNSEKAEKALAPIEKDLKKQEAEKEKAEEKIEQKTSRTRELKSRLGLHATLGVPHPTEVGLDFLTANESFGFSLLGGSSSATFSDTKIGISHMELQLRYHPWSSAFYLGLGTGNHTVKASKTETVSGVPVKAEVEIKSPYLSPQVGWIWLWDSGFNLGFQVGAIVPSGNTTSFTTDAPTLVQLHPDYLKLEKDVKDAGDKFGQSTLPLLTLVRVGWLF